MDNKAWAQEVAKKIKEKETGSCQEKCRKGSVHSREWCIQ